MGKVDELRRMREARFAAARATTPAAAPRPAPARKAAATPQPTDAQPQAPAVGTDALCGHRSIGNKSCTREKDHQKTGTKNHRYG